MAVVLCVVCSIISFLHDGSMNSVGHIQSCVWMDTWMKVCVNVERMWK